MTLHFYGFREITSTVSPGFAINSSAAGLAKYVYAHLYVQQLQAAYIHLSLSVRARK